MSLSDSMDDFFYRARKVSVLRLAELKKVKLSLHGDKRRGVCPFCTSKSATAFLVNVRDNNWHCFSCSMGGDAIDFVALDKSVARTEAARYLAGGEISLAPATKRGARLAKADSFSTQVANWIWRNSAPIHDTIAEAYLEQHRALPAALRCLWRPRLRFCSGAYYSGSQGSTSWDYDKGIPKSDAIFIPALAAPIETVLQDANGLTFTRTGVHVTYLDRKSAAKLTRHQTPLKGPARKMWGEAKGGIVRFGTSFDQPGSLSLSALGVAEGVETALALAATLRRREGVVVDCIATLSLHHLQGTWALCPSQPADARRISSTVPGFTLQGVRHLHAAIDNDMGELHLMVHHLHLKRKTPGVHMAAEGRACVHFSQYERSLICAELVRRAWTARGTELVECHMPPPGQDLADAWRNSF